MIARHLCMSTWPSQHVQKTAVKQAVRLRKKTTTLGTRCWSCLRCQAPAQRYNSASRIGRCAGWLCRATLAGQAVSVHGMVSRRATAETPKLSGASLREHQCRRGKQESDCYTPCLTAYMVHCVTRIWNQDCGKECSSEARVTEALSGLDKVRTGSKRTTVLLELA